MMSMNEKSVWYREPMVWMLISIPLAAVIGGVATLFLAIMSNDGLVVDDYYWRGKAINRVLERDQWAVTHGIRADVLIDYDLGLVMARLTAKQLNQLPGQLKLKLSHATRGGFDHTLVLHRTLDGSYRSLLPKLAPGRWYLQMEGSDWRLVGVMRSPDDGQVRVTLTGRP